MKVSIIIPAYNAEKYIDECIKSALNQTYSNLEIIVVDDGSTDSTLKRLEKFTNKIKVITKKNGGAASALNEGIKQAEGEWIKRLDSDDVLYTNAIEELVSEAKKISDVKNSILYGNYDIIDSQGKTISKVEELNYNKFEKFDVNVRLLDHQIGNENTVLIHKSTFVEYGMYNTEMGFEDYELRLRYCLLNDCRLHFVPKTLAKYRIHPTQTTKAKIKNSLEKTNRIRESILEKLDPKQREKYEAALKKYKKNKSVAEKCKYFVRYNLFPYFPVSVSSRLVNLYWESRRKKY